MNENSEEKFWAKVASSNFDDPYKCWKWTAARNNKGYGMCWCDGRLILAHRASYLFHLGEIPNGMFVLHKCDVPNCVNPTHLFLGNQFDNMRDMSRKGRQFLQRNPERSIKGINHPRAKITEDEVLEIRRRYRDGGCQRDIGREFGLGKTTVAHIVNKRTWRHL
jgi:hypothetical protein